jgi:hypothetical protein
MRFSCVVFSAFALAILFGSPAARAWTIDSQSGNNNDGTARFADPDQDVDKLTDPGASVRANSFARRQANGLAVLAQKPVRKHSDRPAAGASRR